MKIRITSGMLIALIINMVYAKAIGVTQGIAAREAGGDMWISTLLATFQGTAVIWLTAVVIQKTPNKEFIELAGHLYGRWVGKLFALLAFVFFVGAFGGVMITFVYHIMDYFLPEAPTWLFIVAGLWVGIFGAYHGLEVMGRMAMVGVLTLIMLNLLLMAGAIHMFDLRNLAPVFEEGIGPIVWASRHNGTDWAMATMMTAIILPIVKNSHNWGRSSALGILMGGVLVVMWPLLEAGVLSSQVTGQYIVACMQLARSARLGYFIHRYEMIMIIFFATSSLVQIMVSLFCASHSLSKILGLKDYRPMLLPASLILGGFSYWIVSDHLRAMYFLTDFWPWVALPMAVGIPVMLYLSGLLMKKKLQLAKREGN